MAALQQEFQGMLAQEIVVRERLPEELASAKGEFAAVASACQKGNVEEVEKAWVALSNNYDRKLVAASSAAEKKFVAEIEDVKKNQKYKEKYEKECEQHSKLKEVDKKVRYNTATGIVLLPICCRTYH